MRPPSDEVYALLDKIKDENARKAIVELMTGIKIAEHNLMVLRLQMERLSKKKGKKREGKSK